MEIKGMVFFDIDGTLIDCSKGIFKPSLRTVESLEKLKKNGFKIALATGRPKSFIDKSVLDLGFDAIVASNGAYAEIDGKILYNQPLEFSIVNNFIKFCNQNKVSFVLEGQDVSLYKEAKKNEIRDFSKEFFIPKNGLMEIENYKNEIKTNKLVVFLESKEKYDAFYNKYKNEFKFMIHPNKLSYDMYINTFSKSVGVKMVYEKLNISRQNTYAFGDGLNDIEMIQEVGKGIAMGDENKELVKHAFMSTKTAAEDGIALALENLKLI